MAEQRAAELCRSGDAAAFRRRFRWHAAFTLGVFAWLVARLVQLSL